VAIFDVLTTSSPLPVAQSAGAPIALVDFNTVGQAQFVGQAPMTSAFIFVQSSTVRPNHPEARFRIDIRALTGYVALRTGWN
jgi:hypothetical protein